MINYSFIEMNIKGSTLHKFCKQICKLFAHSPSKKNLYIFSFSYWNIRLFKLLHKFLHILKWYGKWLFKNVNFILFWDIFWTLSHYITRFAKKSNYSPFLSSDNDTALKIGGSSGHLIRTYQLYYQLYLLKMKNY